jgi:DNA-binding MarR family transcriptional regulator
MSASSDVLDVPRLRQVWAQLGEIINSPDKGARDVEQPFIRLHNAASPQVLSSDDAALSLAKEIYRFRRKRNEFFASTLFADPSWDILLELYVLRREGRKASVKSVCIASGVPPTTALRWIGMLVKQGLLERNNDQADQRVRWITLSDAGFESMHKLLLSGVSPAMNTSDESILTQTAGFASRGAR